MPKPDIHLFLNKPIPIANNLTAKEIPLCGDVSAGYPAEAYNYIEDRLDLNKMIIKSKKNTKCLFALEKAQIGEGITYGDLLVIDTSEKKKKNPVFPHRTNRRT